MEILDNPYSGLFVIAIALVLPLFLVVTTSFLKIAVVLFLVRNALGIQQVPPNMALYAIALVTTAFIMTPVGDAMLQAGLAAAADDGGIEFEKVAGVIGDILQPLEAFMRRNTDPEVIAAFIGRAETLWPESFVQQIDLDNYVLVLVPAFVLSELTVAFEVGLLLFLPFIIVDLVVANILTSLGMMMVSPIVISLPFKLLLFVVIDGWYRLIDGLIISYA